MDEVRRKFDWWWDTQLARHVVSGSGTDSATNAAWAGWQAAYAAGQREMRERAAGFMDSMQDAAREAGDKAIVGAFGVFAQTVRALPIGGTDGP